ncbi:hypothetical protein [Rhizobium laguerreae]|uniref:hypothetical protein n=1 Tax=Rhizobium laguerreae TaxID=1076926 RepID=UPI001A8F28AC|nr:hypothetical protein [Rhizobium laguerreae]MBN9983072.1 hypothetical protein [Rhizobium laguerreae]
MRQAPFTQPTIIAASELLEQLTQDRFNQLVLRIGLEDDFTSSTTVSVAKKSDMLGRITVQRSASPVITLESDMTLGEAVVREAIQLVKPNSPNPLQVALERGVARDGYVIAFDENDGTPSLRAALPDEIQRPMTDDGAHQLLRGFQFHTSLGHLDQAIDTHARGDWAACNSMLRTFLESLFDDIARNVDPRETARRPTSENRRALLADVGFLAADRNEWIADGKNYISGLHTEGARPGLSDEDHSTFRLHIVLITARTFLRRLHYGR